MSVPPAPWPSKVTFIVVAGVLRIREDMGYDIGLASLAAESRGRQPQPSFLTLPATAGRIRQPNRPINEGRLLTGRTSTAPSIGVQSVQISAHELSQEVQRMQALASPPQIEPVLSPSPTPTPTPSPTVTPAPTPEPVEVPPPQPTEEPSPTETYIVQPDDSLSDIAAKYETTVDELLRLNDLAQPDLLYDGQAILVPCRPEAAVTTTVHVVQAGETLGLIGDGYGTTIEVLLELNDLPEPDIVPVGTSLVVPQPP